MNKVAVIQALQDHFDIDVETAEFTEFSPHVCHVTWPGFSVCVRFTLKNQFDRELNFLKFASERDWAPNILAKDENKEWVITEWLPGNTIQSSDYKNPVFVQRYLQQLRELHQSSITNAIKCVPTIERIDFYLEHLPYANLRIHCQYLAEQLQQHPLMIGTIHNDLHAGNAIINGEKIAWVDWSEAGVGDVGNDLAEILIFFPQSKHIPLVETYFNRELTDVEKTTVKQHCQLRYGLCAAWALAMVASIDPDFLYRPQVFEKNPPEVLLHQILSHEKSLITANDYYLFAMSMIEFAKQLADLG